MKHGGDIVAFTLKQHNVKYIFTLCGGHISPILVSCAQNDIRVIDVRHEATAVFAADAISRLSPAIGVAAVTAGPGLTNTLTAVKNLQTAPEPQLHSAEEVGRSFLYSLSQILCRVIFHSSLLQ